MTEEQEYQVQVINKFLKDLYELPILFEFNGFELRDIYALNKNLDYIDTFLSDYYDPFYEILDQAFNDPETDFNSENECGYGKILNADGIKDALYNIYLDELEDFEGAWELFKPGKTRKFLNHNYCIFKHYYKYWSDNVAEEFCNKSLFISWYYKEYSLPWQDWQAIEQKLNDFVNKQAKESNK
jgi:hypothetical protein